MFAVHCKKGPSSVVWSSPAAFHRKKWGSRRSMRRHRFCFCYFCEHRLAFFQVMFSGKIEEVA